MRRFWGRNESFQNNHKFIRDDDQITALNYENLCDSDYLARLFAQDNTNPTATGVIGGSSTAKDDVVESRPTDCCSVHPEISEDAIVFGNVFPLGQYFYKKRLLREISATIKTNDPLSLQINRQVAVFDHIATLLTEKCKLDYTSASLLKKESSPMKYSTSQEKAASPHPLSALSAVTVKHCFSFITVNDSRVLVPKLSSSKVQSVILSLVQFFKLGNSLVSDLLLLPQFGEMRKIFNQSTALIFSTRFLNYSEWSKKAFEEDVKVVLSGVYGILGIGLLTNNSTDILAALNYLMLLMIIVEEKVDNYLSKIKELLTSATAVSGSVASVQVPVGNNISKQIPSKVQGKLKSSTKPTVQKVPGEAAVEETSLLPSSQMEVNREISPSVVKETSRPNSSNQEGSVVQSGLKSFGSTAKLWEKPTNKSLEGNAKGKINPKKQQQEARMLYEILDSSAKESIAVQPTVLVSNHVLISYNNNNESLATPFLPTSNATQKYGGIRPVANNSEVPFGTVGPRTHLNGRADKFRQHRELEGSAEISPRINLKRIEKEIKTSHNSMFHLPQLVLKMCSEFCNSLQETASSVLQTSSSQKVLSSSAQTRSLLPRNQGLKFSSASNHSSNRVWSSGQNTYGELGMGDTTAKKSFVRIASLDDKQIISIGAGNEHSLFVTAEGKLFACGYNDNGQCAAGSVAQVLKPALVQSLEEEEVSQVSVYNGCEHTLAVTKDGRVFAFGYNARGQVNFFVFFFFDLSFFPLVLAWVRFHE
jgi:hypothetical protein